MDHNQEAIAFAKQQLEGELLEMTLYILGETHKPKTKSQYFEQWRTAYLVKNPSLEFHAYGNIGSKFHLNNKMTGDLKFNLEKKIRWAKQYNYKTRKYEPVQYIDKLLTIEPHKFSFYEKMKRYIPVLGKIDQNESTFLFNFFSLK